MRFLSLFAGIGGFDLGLERAGMECVGQVEINPFCQRVLAHHWPHVKRIGDIRDVNRADFGAVDLICGGFPCQPFSTAGKRKGTTDDRYLWPEMLRIIEAYRPAWILGENVTGIVSMALDTVLFNLEAIGYSVQTFIIPACSVNAPHRRDRIWIIAKFINPNDIRCLQCNESKKEQQYTQGRQALSISTTPNIGTTNTHSEGLSVNIFRKFGSISSQAKTSERGKFSGTFTTGEWWEEWPQVATRLCGMDDGVSGRVDRLRSLGNAVVPQVVEILGRAIMTTERAASMPQEVGQKDNKEGVETHLTTPALCNANGTNDF